MKKPKGLTLFDRDLKGDGSDLTMEEGDNPDAPTTVYVSVGESSGWFDADQLDKMASRCTEWAKYLRSLPKDSTKSKKWEDM